jgi:protein phosphatase 2C family protein 2/3
LNGVISAGKEKEKVRLPELEPSKVSSKENGVVKAFAINTHAGISRSYNEDRVSITLNIKKNGVRSQFFAVYDGHGGSNCCDYLKDNLHEFVINHKDFPADPKKSLFEAIMACENKYCELVKMSHSRGEGLEKSGSCALIVLIVEDYCYVANVGDSRAILSTDGGRYAFNLSRDHRPIDTKEQQRVFSKGGKIYRTEMTKILGRKEEKP